MHRRVNVLCAAAMAVLCAVPLIRSADAAPKSYPMMCRGGGSMYFSLATSLANGDFFVSIHFSKGGRAADPGPGECTWLDRGMRADEPKHLRYQAPDSVVVPFIRANKTAFRFNYGGRRRSQLQYLVDAIVQGRPFQVHAYQQRAHTGNYFTIVRVGP